MRILTAAILGLALAGCDVTVNQPPSQSGPPRTAPSSNQPSTRNVQAFRTVVARVEPVAEQVCRARTRNLNCDFRIVVDSRASMPPNAFQTVDRSGRPIIGFTASLIATARNADELAFIMGHEAAHHIRGHIPQTQKRAVEGALLGTVLATIAGGDPAVVDTAQRIGGTVGARRFAKNFELEADQLGTVISARAGYDPVNGARYFTRIPDPGNTFLGTHPPNAQRIDTVRRTAAGL